MVCYPTHHHTLILPLYLSPPSPSPPLWICTFFHGNNFLWSEHLKWQATSFMFLFHFWHLLISNLNGYQGQTSAYLPAPSYQVLMQMHPICYLEWRCLVLKDADSLCEKSFSPDNDKGTKWEITPQAKGVTSCILKQKYSIKFKVCLCCILNLNIAHEWSWTYRNHEGWFSISNQDKHISIQTMLINP